MMNPTISIIIPVFNGASFIKQALDSLCMQISPHIEIIVVDDGSKDNTVDLIRTDFQSYIDTLQLKIFSQLNQGVSAARNLGVDNAKGDYVGFMDADDLALPNYISTLLAATMQQPDIVEFGFKTFTQSIDEVNNNPTLYTNNQFGLHNIAKVIDKVYSTSSWYAWSRVFKKHLLQEIRFPVGVRFGEDLMTVSKLYEIAKTVYALPNALYAYRTNPHSATFRVQQDYVDNLVHFYHTIPKLGFIRHDYLRLAVAACTLSCQVKKSGGWDLPEEIQQDMYRLRSKPLIYQMKAKRSVLMLLYPKLYEFIMHFKFILKK